MLNPVNLILLGSAILSAYALPTLPPRSTTSRIIARQTALLTQPTTVNTSRTFTTSFGPMVEVCVVTLTPITAPNGVAAVEEVRACTVGIQPTNNAGGGGAPSNPATPPPPPPPAADSAAPPAATQPPVDSAAPPAPTDSGFAPAPTDSAALPAASNTDPFAPTPSDAAVSNIGAPGASSDAGAAPTPVSDGGAAPSNAAGSAAPAPTDAAAAVSSGVAPVSVNPVSTVNAADLPGFSAAPAASAIVSAPDAGASGSVSAPAATDSAGAAAPSSPSTDASVSPADAGASPSASAAAAEQSAPADDGTPGRTFSVLPIGLGVFAGISAIALIVVGLVTYERTKYRKAFRQRKLAEAGGAMAYGGMQQRT